MLVLEIAGGILLGYIAINIFLIILEGIAETINNIPYRGIKDIEKKEAAEIYAKVKWIM